MLRRQKDIVLKDLRKKIVFLVGPRQTGKTWLAKDLGKEFGRTEYLSYDRLADRRIIEKEGWVDATDLLILDELHKMPDWKNYLKGLFDTKNERLKILVTGSARLDYFRQSGDSMAGRFFTHRLLPFSLGELAGTPYEGDLDRLFERSGFPEPFLAETPEDATRWRNEYADSLLRDEVTDLERVADLRALRTVLELLRHRVGSPISYASIAEDVGVSPNTVKKYIQIFEALYIVFRVTPFSRDIARSLAKEPKLYFYDIGMVESGDGPRFENFVAVSLLKDIFATCDQKGVKGELHYLKTKEGKEVDFCVARNGRAELLVEAKRSDDTVSPHLRHFCTKYDLPGVQVVKELKRERKEDERIEVRRAKDWLAGLY